MYLSVVIPAYNEENRIAKTLADVKEYLKQQPYEYEVIVVNDGSEDKTVEVVKKIGDDFPELRIIDNKKNCGKGHAVMVGLLQGKGKYRLFADADNSTRICEFENFLPYFDNGFDIVIGSRRLKGSVIAVPQPFYRMLLGNFFGFLTKIITGLRGVIDSQCGFKVFKAGAAEDILPRCRIDRWAFDPEILIIAEKLGYKIKEAPVSWASGSQSKVRFLGMVMSVFDLLRIRWNLICKKYEK